MIRMIFAISLFLCGYAQAEALKDSVPNVAVVGEASEDVAPDRATLRFGVVTERPTAAAAAADNAAAIKTILDELKTMGVADADMQTEQVSLAPMQTEERDAKGKTKTTTTYRASNRLAVQIKPVEKASDIVGRVLEKGANTLDGVEYDNGGLEEKRDELRAKAVKDAERRSRIYAEAAGLRLARVIEIRPLDYRMPVARTYDAEVAAAPNAKMSVPLRPGMQNVTERVSIIWALSR
ncbi:MAG: SIMPL domain-containing protein [Hyphomicrobiales bacterium]|jgi:hypothetical protein